MTSGEARPRVLLVGLGATTRSALDGLLPAFDVVALIRDGEDETTAHARRADVPVRLEPTLAGVQTAIDELSPDAVLVSSFNRIIGPAVLDRCPFVNVHYAPLPRGRGRATVNWAIINGDDRAWISIHHLVPALDAGGILYQGSVPIGPTSTVASLYEELNELQRANVADAILAAMAGDPGATQDEAEATYYCTRVPADGEVDWSRPAADVERLVRALQPPFPHAFTWHGLDRIEIIRAEVLADAPAFEGRVAGRVVAVDRRGGPVDVQAGVGTVRLHEVASEDGETVPASSVITSVRATLGLTTTTLADELRRLRAQMGEA